MPGQTGQDPIDLAAADVDQDTLGEDERLTLTRVVRRMYEAVGDDRIRVRTHIEATGGDGGTAGGYGVYGYESLEISGTVTATGGNGKDEGQDGIYSRIWNIQSLLEEELAEKEGE